MPRAKQIELTKVRALLRLGQEIHGAIDPESRKQLLLEGLSILVNASAAASFVTRMGEASDQPVVVSTVRFPSATEGAGGLAVHKQGAKHPTRPSSSAGRRRHTSNRPVQHPLARLRSSLELGGNIFANIEIQRAGNRFSAHDRKLVDLVHQEMRWIYEHDVLLTSADAAGLSDRQRQTLELLMAGDSEKQIATKLHISPNTIHHYVKRIYRHYGVNTRGELLARVFVASRNRPQARDQE